MSTPGRILQALRGLISGLDPPILPFRMSQGIKTKPTAKSEAVDQSEHVDDAFEEEQHNWIHIVFKNSLISKSRQINH